MNTCENVISLSKITYFSSIGKCLLTITCLQGPYNLSHFVHTMCTCSPSSNVDAGPTIEKCDNLH